MAVTQGHGNADWTRDETILALELYLARGESVPGKGDPRVVALSALLRALPIHRAESRVGSFRNPEGVAFKLQNLRQVDSGKGLDHVSKTDREVWAAFGGDPVAVSILAARIRDVGGERAGDSVPELDADEEFLEGRLMTVHHQSRERSQKLRRKLLADRARRGALRCDGCAWSPGILDPLIADAAFEAHHLEPLASTGPTANRVKDLALLCARCHRLVHRWIAVKGEWLTPARIQEVVGRA